MAQTRQSSEFGIDLDTPPEAHQSRRRARDPRSQPELEHDDVETTDASWTDPRFLVPLALFLAAVFVIGLALRAGSISTGQGSDVSAQELVDRVIAAETRAGFRDFTVRAEGGLIILEGETASSTEAVAIGAVARSVDGVQSVDNRLIISGGTLEQQAQSSTTTPPSIDTETLSGRLAAAGEITFETASASLTADGTATINAVAEILLEVPGVAIEIHGHTDSDGDSTANERLSQERAEAVVTALGMRGVDTELLTPIGFGESQPIEPNITEEGRAKNRRITFAVVP